MKTKSIHLTSSTVRPRSSAVRIDPSEPLGNPRHEAFAGLQATGKSGTRAYMAVYQADPLSAKANGSRLRARADVMARVRYLQNEFAAATVMDLREILEFLTRVKRTPIGEADALSDVVRRFETGPDGRKRVRMLDKRKCVQLAARLQGFLRAKKTRGSGRAPTASPHVLTEERRAYLIALKRAATMRAAGLTPSPVPDCPSPISSAAPDPSEPLRLAQHEAFARLLAAGWNGRQAYSFTFGCSQNSAKGSAPALRARAEIVARVQHLQSEATSGAVMDLREILEFLTAVKRTPGGHLDTDSELIQRIEIRPGFREVWMPDKRACIELAARLLAQLPASAVDRVG